MNVFSLFNDLIDRLPSSTVSLSLTILIVNLIIPGLGTILLGNNGNLTENIVCGVLQFFLSFIYIGYIWSIAWGLILVLKAK